MLYDTTPEKAGARRRDLVTLIGAGLLFVPSPLTVKALTEEWMKQHRRKGLAVTTIDNYRDTLNSCVLPYVGHLQIKDFQPGALERMFNGLQDRGLSDSTIKHVRRVCKLFIKYAVWKKYLRESPLEGLELPKGAEPRETRSLTPAEARTLVETALLDLGDLIFVFALFMGMRPKECLGLPLSNVELVDDAAALVRVTQQAVKLRRAPGHIFTRPKTRKGVREVPFPAWLYRELMRLQCANAARERLLGAGWTDYGLVFPSRTGRPISEGWLRDMFARLLKRSGLPPHFTPYSLRYTYNTLLSEGGVADKARCVLMGHAREDFNRAVYVRTLPQMFEGVAETLERQIFGASRPSFAPGESGPVM
ncbi:MAG TPA: tyrosine-type recombinase/integrase [Pyrinomonadaceae bacterium]